MYRALIRLETAPGVGGACINGRLQRYPSEMGTGLVSSIKFDNLLPLQGELVLRQITPGTLRGGGVGTGKTWFHRHAKDIKKKKKGKMGRNGSDSLGRELSVGPKSVRKINQNPDPGDWDRGTSTIHFN